MERLREIVSGLGRARVAVVGDFIADRYVYGRPVKLSREAPVVVLRHEREALVPGCAANTVNNLRALGASVRALGAVGRDALGDRLLDALAGPKVDVSGVARTGTETVEKIRILAGDRHTAKQQVIRIDKEDGFAMDAAAEEELCRSLEGLAGACSVLVVSDYGYRTVTEKVREAVLSLADRVEILVDSHERLGEFPGVWMVTPNEAEAEREAGRPLRTEADARESGRALRSKLGAEHVLLTRGNQGMILFSRESEVFIPISGTEEITDVSGAGDTVVAVLSAARSAGAPAEDAARLANVAAGVVVMKRGTAVCTPAELAAALEGGA